jgi:hypothetical protein
MTLACIWPVVCHVGNVNRRVMNTIHRLPSGLCALIALAVWTGAYSGRGADFTVVNSGSSAYSINSQNNPGLTLQRGKTYTFAVTASGHPFYIKTVQGNGTGNGYSGATGNGTQTGTVTLVLPTNAPATLFYNCSIHSPMTGTITVIDPPVPPAPKILKLTVGTNLLVRFTGSNTFSYFPEFNTNLVKTNWFALTVQTNIAAGGTNDVYCGKPSGSPVFIRIRAQ